MDVDSLNIIAEVGAALAGFATLAGVIGRNHRDRFYAFGIVEASLIALVFSLLPRIVVSIRATALLFFFVWSAAWINAMRKNFKATGQVLERQSTHPVFIAASCTIMFAGSVFSLLIVLPIWPEYNAWFYQSAVICPLLISCFLLWLTVKGLLHGDEDQSPI